MAKFSRKSVSLTIGLDLGNDVAHVCVLGEQDTPLEEGRVALTPQALTKRFGTLAPTRFALEAGSQSAWVARELKTLGHEVLVAQPRKLRLIFENPKKCDRIDAYQLAYYARNAPKALCAIEHRSLESQADLSIVEARAALVEARTKLINFVRGTTKGFGTRLPRAGSSNFAEKVERLVPDALREALDRVLETIQQLSETIGSYDTTLEELCAERYRTQTGAMRQIPGVGPVTSLSFALKVETPARFSKSRDVAAYFGLTPRRDQSGKRDPQLGITKAGDPKVRRLLIQAAHYVLGPFGPDTDLRRFGERLSARGGKSAKKKAIVAVARKLAVLMHRLWVTAEVYEPLRQAERELRKAKRAQGVAGV